MLDMHGRVGTVWRTPRWIAIIWLLTFGVMLLGRVPLANATHSDTGSTKHHQRYIHQASSDGTFNGDYDEDYCVESHTGYISSASAGAQVFDSLNNALPRWDGINYGSGATDWRLDLWKTNSACNAYANKDWIEIEYHVSKNNSDVPYKWCNENYSCVSHYTPVYNSVAGHTDFTWEWVFLDYDNLSSSGSLISRRVINHETGHVLGLFDGQGSCSPTSLMHNLWYGCSYSDWRPTSADFDSVRAIMNGR